MADPLAKLLQAIQEANPSGVHSKALASPKRDFVKGEWSFRTLTYEGGTKGFGVWRKGERGGYGRRGELTCASDGTTWMFCIFIDGVGRPDARPSFDLALAEVMKILKKNP